MKNWREIKESYKSTFTDIISGLLGLINETDCALCKVKAWPKKDLNLNITMTASVV